MNLNYRLNGGQYVLYKGDQPTTAPVDEISLVIDRAAGILHRHGNSDQSRAWIENAQAKFRDGGHAQFADDLVLITGRFPLDEINRCLEARTYVTTFYKRLVSGEIKPLPLDWTPETAATFYPTPEEALADDVHDASESVNPFLRFRA